MQTGTVKFNKLLDRQIRKYLGEDFKIPDQFHAIFSAVSQSYEHYERDRNLMEHSLEVSSEEMLEIRDRLEKTNQGLEQNIEIRTSELRDEINTREKTASALRFSESTKTAILNAIPDSMYILDRAGVILDFYSAERGIDKAKFPDTIGTNLAKYIDPLTARKGLVLIRQTIRKNQLGIIEHQRNDGGTTIYYEARLTKIDENSVLVINRNITRHKNIAASLRETEEGFRYLFDFANDGIILVDLETKQIIDANRKAYEKLGYTKNELLKLRTTDLNVRKSEQEERKISQSIKKKGSHVFERDEKKKNGSVLPVEVSTRILNFKDRKILLSFIRDITDRKKSEQELRLYREKLQTVISNIPLVLFAIDKDGNYTISEGKGLKTLGYKPNQLVGKNIFKVYKDNDQVIANNRKALNGKSFNDIVKVHDHFFEAHYAPLYSDSKKVVGVIGVSYDVTSRVHAQEEILKSNQLLELRVQQRTRDLVKANKQLIKEISEREKVENELKHQQEFLTSVIDSNPNLIYVKDKQGRYLIVNHSLAEILGTSVQSLIGKNIDKLVKQKDETKNFKTQDKLVIKSNQPLFIPEEKVTYASGEVRWYQTKKIPLKLSNNKMPYILGVSTDITSHKKFESELSLQSEMLKRSNMELENFAYVASHDLQEPIRSISSYLQLLEKRYAHKLGKDADTFIRFSVEGAKRMHFLINDLLEYSRVNMNAQPFATTSIMKVLEIVKHNLHAVIQNSGADIIYKHLPTIHADQSQLVQLFQNLIDNAIKFRSKKKLKIHIHCKQNKSEWIFSIRDNGIGIRKQFAEKIFIIFQRLHTQDKYAGTGIGLAICKKIIQRHQGKIWLESKTGKGTTFYFTIHKNIK